MSGDEFHIVAQRPKPVTDGVNELIVIPSRQIGASDGASKQHVTDQRQAVIAVEKHQMAWRVARAMQDFQCLAAEADRITLL